MSEEKEVVVAEEVVAEATEPKEVKDEMASVLIDHNNPIITTKKLMEAGVHFGHQTKRWNPAMKPYIYTARNGIYIIDLNKTVAKIIEAYDALKKIVADGGKVIFVGTKKSCQEIVEEEANRCGSFYATNRWLGGTLTNFRTIQKRIKFLRDIETMEKDGTFQVLPKKEVSNYYKEKEKLEKSLGGIKEMRKLPQALFVIDPRVEVNAVREAKKLRIPVFGVVDTNSDPLFCDYVIPANDDATKSVKLILQVMADAIVEAKGGDMSQILVAYTKDEGEEATMDDAIANFDAIEKERQAAKKAALEAKREQMARQRKPFNKGPRKEYTKSTKDLEEKPAEEAKAEAPVEEAKAEAPAEVKKPRAKKAPVEGEEKPAAKKAPKAKKPAEEVKEEAPKAE